MNRHTKDIKVIFAEAIEKTSGEAQAAYLEDVCGGDTELRSMVEALLASHRQAGGFFKKPALGTVVTINDASLTEGPGTVVGRYKLLEKVGEGGMAVVYMAVQEQPIRRKVALKIIKLGMDTKHVIARFEAERQALAMMDHPNIAKVYDAGATETGRPYFVMELVTGLSITEYCDGNHLSTPERLGLFIQVCNAVQHAHQKGIVHRDIKPSNVMVTLHDREPVPKVIDFGIAKATNQKLTEKTLFTRYAHIIGTPAYMSPEQAELSEVGIDSRSDVYSLGVLLYELLTGTTPFSEEELLKAGYHEMQRIIREEEPAKPSTKLMALGETLSDMARRRSVTPDLLRKTVRGDLDWIAMKTLEKDRNRRYETAQALAADIERHLRHEPVLGGPPDAGYRLRKFVRRNRVAVITFALVAAALAIGAAAATIAVWSSGRLPGKVEHAAGMVQRHVWNVPPKSDLLGGISPDGRYLSYVDWTAGNLAVYDLLAGVNWPVTEDTDSAGKNTDGWAESSTISNDGTQIAYAWYNDNRKFYDLRIVDVDGTNLRVLYHDAAVFWIKPYAWSLDGKDILVYFSDADKSLVDEKTGTLFRKGHLVMVSVADGSVRILKTWQSRACPKTAVFSPNGRYIAYDLEHAGDLTRHDIFLMDLDGNGEVRLIEHPADDQLSGWTPDGRSVVFTSDRGSKRDLWMIEVTGGLSRGEPRKLMGPLAGQPLGFTAAGSLYYGVSTTAANVYIARLDPSGAEFEGEPELVSTQFVGATMMGDFSSDGKSLAYRAGTGAGQKTSSLGPGDWILLIYSFESSQERIVSPAQLFRPKSRMRGPRWSPDGRSLLVFGEGPGGGYGLYRVDVETGIPQLITPVPDGLTQAVWAPDGKWIYTRSPDKLRRLDLATGQATVLYTGGGGLKGVDVSPNGRWLAFYQGEDSLVVMPSVGGELREVVHLDKDEVNNTQASFVRWTPDGGYLLLSRREGQLWKVHAESGAQQQIGPAINGLVGASMHPNGRQITFTVEQTGSALWVMESFLPE